MLPLFYQDQLRKCHGIDASQLVTQRGHGCADVASLLHHSTQTLFGSNERRVNMSAQLLVPREMTSRPASAAPPASSSHGPK